jgi:hypothetical protein
MQDDKPTPFHSPIPFSSDAYGLASSIFQYSEANLSQLAQAVKGLPEVEKLLVQALDRGLCISLLEICQENQKELSRI